MQSDLKVLSVNYPGVAKCFYYWASIYSKNKIYIAYDLFLNWQTYSKLHQAMKTNEYSSLFHIKPFLKFIQQSPGFIKSAGELSLFAFNHDIEEDG